MEKELTLSNDTVELRDDSIGQLKSGTDVLFRADLIFPRTYYGWFSVGICKYKPGYKSYDLLFECSH